MLFAFITSTVLADVSAKSTFGKVINSISPTQTKDSPASTKKDGTPDKRFKANKKPRPVVIPLKKDGTPDGRYKVTKNKKDTVKS